MIKNISKVQKVWSKEFPYVVHANVLSYKGKYLDHYIGEDSRIELDSWEDVMVDDEKGLGTSVFQIEVKSAEKHDLAIEKALWFVSRYQEFLDKL